MPRWRREPRRFARAPIVIGVGVLAALVLALVTRPAAPARPATYARAEQLREEKHVPTADPVSPELWRSSWQPRAAAGVVGLCLLASLALGSVALVVERRGRRDSTGDRGTDPAHRDFFLRLGYAGAGACFGVAISVAIVLATTRLRPDGSVPGAVTPRPSRANVADTLGPAPRSQSLGGRDQSDVAVPAMAVRRTEPPLRSAKGAGEGPRDVTVNRERPALPGPAPASVPAGPVADASSIGEAPSEPEASASPAFTVPALPTTETPGAEMTRVQTLDVETARAETAKAETTKAETTKADTAKVEVPKAEVPKTETPSADVPKGYMPKVGTPKTEAPKPETARVDPATLQKPQAQTSDRPRAASSAPDQNLIDKIRDDWTIVKGQAKSDVDGIVRTLRHWLRRD